jgi:Short C-terminal domain
MTSSERGGVAALANANKIAGHMRGILQAAMQSLAVKGPVATSPSEPKDQSQDPATRLRTLQSLLTQGLITQEDFDTRKKEILSQI